MVEVKEQPTGFQIHPENINLEGAPNKEFRWREIFIERVQQKKEGQERKVLMADAMIEKAITGDVPAFNAIADRMEGKPAQGVDLTSKGEKIEGVIVDLIRHETTNTIPGEA